MKNELYEKLYKDYEKGYSLQDLGKMYGLTRQAIYCGFKVRNYQLRTKKLLPFQTFKGVKFTLRNHGYYSRTDGNRALMHRYVWEYYNKEIPDGYDIHHINHNKSDNRIENLELYTKSEHARKFNARSKDNVNRAICETNETNR